jgi:hypothetical protein
VRIPAPGTNAPPNVPFQIVLDRGQGFRAEALLAGTDLTGTLIESDKPIAMLNGNICTNVPSSTAFCDHIFEVAHPLRSWGTSALVSNLPNRNGGSIYRVVASVDGTQVSRDGALQATLNKGQFLETGPLTGGHLFEADHPIFVTQFMTGSSSPGAALGDPAMANSIPPDQYLKSYTFSTVGIAVRQALPHRDRAAGQLDRLDHPGRHADRRGPVHPDRIERVPSALLSIAQGSHTTASPQPHGITVEGINQDDSYVYPGGAQIEFINQFCGDGAANRDSEECDGTDFRGSTCASFGFASGFLQCTDDCRVDKSQCSGFTVEDKDDDGFPASDDCNDLDPQVNPGMPEIPGNGIDDDCNPATPDVIPQGIAGCELHADRILYAATDVVTLEGAVTNAHESFSLTGLSSSLTVLSTGGTSIHDEARQFAALAPERVPGASSSRRQEPAGSYTAELSISAADVLGGVFGHLRHRELDLDRSGPRRHCDLEPERVAPAIPPMPPTPSGRGNAPQTDLAIRSCCSTRTGAVMDELLDAATRARGQPSATQPFSTIGLATNKGYLAVLLAKPPGTDLVDARQRSADRRQRPPTVLQWSIVRSGRPTTSSST